MLGAYIHLATAIVLGALGQLALKYGAEQSASIAEQLHHPSSVLGLAIYGLTALLYMKALREVPVSIAFPSISASYIIVVFAAHLLWNEAFGIQQIAGIMLIGCGIFFLFV